MKNEAVYAMSFARIYSLYVTKVERKGRTKAELDEVLSWLTGYSFDQMKELVNGGKDLSAFFHEAPMMNERRFLVHGSICGVKIDDIPEPLMKDIRIMDKLVDELAKGKAMEKILR